VLLQEQEGEAFLLHVDTGRYFGLNRTGLTIWRALVEGVDPVEALARRWPDVSDDVRHRDVDTLLSALRDAGLVRDPDAPA
jgi:hypothetical protein